MKEGFASQWQSPCLIIETGDGNLDPDEVVQEAFDIDAIYENVDGQQLIVQFPGRPAEIYTERAFRSGLRGI